MEVGRSNPNIGAIIQVRYGSTRLPGKVLMPLPYPNGKPLLQWIIDSLRNCDEISRVVIATSKNPENDRIEKFAIDNGIDVFRGDEEDVQSRFISIIESNNFDHVIRLTGDNPIVDRSLLINTINTHLSGNHDFTKTVGAALGTNIAMIRASILLDRKLQKRSEAEIEHVTAFLKDSNHNKKEIFVESNIKNLRLTIDYAADYAMLSLLFSYFNEAPTLDEIANLIRSNPWIQDVNASQIQKQI